MLTGGSWGATDADERLERLFAQIDHLGIDEFGRVALSHADVVGRTAERDEAVGAIRSAGRGQRLDAALVTVEAFVERVYSTGGRQMGGGLTMPTHGSGRLSDRVAALAAVEDAVIATLARDLVPADVAERLLAPYDILRSYHRGGSPAAAAPTIPKWLIGFGAAGLAIVVVVPFLFTPAAPIIIVIVALLLAVGVLALILRRRPPTF